MSPLTLRNCSVNYLVKYFRCISPTNVSDIEKIHTYLDDFQPVLYEVAKKSFYYTSENLSLIFLPIVVKKGKLKLTDQNISLVLHWLQKLTIKDQLDMCYIRHLVLINNEGHDFFQFMSMITNLKNLTILQIHTWVTDDLLAALSMFCPQLEVFDAQEDTGAAVTDAGLGFLSQCKKLRIVIFSNMYDEYDYEDVFKFTYKGIAMLLLTMPQLLRMECPEYLIRDAIQYVYQMSFRNCTLSLRCLLLAFPCITVKTINILPFICPYLDTLSLSVKTGEEKCISSSLMKLHELKTLALNAHHNYQSISSVLQGNNIFNMDWSFGKNLVNLHIQTYQIMSQELIELSASCPHLQTLFLQLFSFKKNHTSFKNQLLFSNLKKLELAARNGDALLVFLCSRIPTLCALYTQYSSLENPQKLFEYLIAKPVLLNIVLFALPCELDLSIEYVLKLMQKCISLKQLAMTVNDSCVEKILLQFISHKNLSVQICDYDNFVPPRKLLNLNIIE